MENTDIRLATIEGHIKAIRAMNVKGGNCEQVIMQLLAVERAIKKVGVMVLNHHLNTCIKSSIEDNDKEIMAKFSKLLEVYL